MSSNNQQLSFYVSGMHCASCAANIQRQLNKTSGVVDASVNYANEQASVNFQPDKVSTTKLEEVVKSLGYTAHISDVKDDQTADLAAADRAAELKNIKLKLIVSGILSAILVLGMFPFTPSFLMNPWLQWLLATPVLFWAGKRFYQGAWSGLQNRTTNMDTLVVLGTSVAYFYSVFAILFGDWLLQHGIEPHVYFEASAVIIFFILLGKFMEIRAKGQTSAALKKLIGLQPSQAQVWQQDKWVTVDIKEIKVGDRLLVKPGAKIPVDGLVVKGESAVDESMVTGESMPVLKQADDKVIGATLNDSGSLEIIAQKVGDETVLSHIIKLVKEAQGSRPPIQKLVDLVASYFVPVVIILAVITFLIWLILGPEPAIVWALVSMINVLIIACPCALGLATPTSLMVGVGRGAQLGILIKDAESLEVANKIKAILFDKTGTLTEGKPQVQHFQIEEKATAQVLNMVYAVEELSHHPLASAMVNFVAERQKNIKKLDVKKFKDIPGKGVIAEVGGKKVAVGNLALMQEQHLALDAKIQKSLVDWQAQGMTSICVAVDNKAVAAFAIADVLKAESLPTIEKLKAMNIKPILMTGDNQSTAAVIADQLHIEEFYAEVLPQDKEHQIQKLQKQYGVVAMVGDGINDAPALAAADVGIAMGGGTDVAIESSGITLLRSDISLVPQAIKLSHATMSNIRQNLSWAFGYNIILIPVAMGVLYPFWGILLNPMLAGAAMAFSSVSVVLNALRLKQANIS